MPFPLIKLASLLVKQMAKPVGNVVKRSAKASPAFQKICMKPAELYHSFDINVRMRLLGLGKPKEKQKLSTEKAVELGAELIGEAFLYLLFGGIVVGEYYVSTKNSEREKEKSKQYQTELENRITDLEFANAHADAQLRELMRTVGDLDSKNYSLMKKVFPKGINS